MTFSSTGTAQQYVAPSHLYNPVLAEHAALSKGKHFGTSKVSQCIFSGPPVTAGILQQKKFSSHLKLVRALVHCDPLGRQLVPSTGIPPSREFVHLAYSAKNCNKSVENLKRKMSIYSNQSRMPMMTQLKLQTTISFLLSYGLKFQRKCLTS